MTLWLLVKVFVVVAIVFSYVPGLIILERRLAGFIQGRWGPNRVGPFGTLQPLADIIKFILKEDIVPERADRALDANVEQGGGKVAASGASDESAEEPGAPRT